MSGYDRLSGITWDTKLSGHQFTYYLYGEGDTALAADEGPKSDEPYNVQGQTLTTAGNSDQAAMAAKAFHHFANVANVSFAPAASVQSSTLQLMTTTLCRPTAKVTSARPAPATD